MHAASVNPEPGSNSLKNYILNPRAAAPRLKIFFRAIFNLASSYFLSIFFFQSVLTRSFALFSAQKFLVVQFSMIKCSLSEVPRFARFVIILPSLKIVKKFFGIFLNLCAFFRFVQKLVRFYPFLVNFAHCAQTFL